MMPRKKERVHELLKLSEELKKDYYEKFIGKTLDVIVETIQDNKYMVGHTSNLSTCFNAY